MSIIGLKKMKTSVDSVNHRRLKMPKETRLFASFHNKEHQKEMFEQLLSEIPKNKHFVLFTYLGMMESTIAEGYTDNKEVEE